MVKPILATNIDDLLIDHEAFIEPHKAWFDRAIEKTGNKNLEKWKGQDDYFIGVNEAMTMIMPDATPEEKTRQARTWYQEDVISYIKEHPSVVIKSTVDRLKGLKERFTLALLTTNTEDYIEEILQAASLQGIYDIVMASKTEEEPEKSEIINTLVRKHGTPKYYLTAKQEPKVVEKFKELGTKVISPREMDKV